MNKGPCERCQKVVTFPMRAALCMPCLHKANADLERGGFEPIRHKHADGFIRGWTDPHRRFTLYLWKADRRPDRRIELRYEFWDAERLIFSGAGYCPPVDCLADSDRSIGGLLGFLSSKPGEVEAKYFKRHKYTEEQMTWARENGDELAIFSMQLEGVEDE